MAEISRKIDIEAKLTGNRKMRAFYLSSAALLTVVIVAFVKGGDATELFEAYSLFQTIIAGGFFGFNGLEHYSKAKAAGNGK